MKPVQPPLVVIATSIPISLFIIWWLYRKRITKDTKLIDHEPDNGTKELQPMTTEQPKNGLFRVSDGLSDATEFKKSVKKCDMCPVPISQTVKGEENSHQFSDGAIMSPINGSNDCDNHVEIGTGTLVNESTCPVITCKDSKPDGKSEKLSESSTDSSIKHVESEEKSILMHPGVHQQESPKCVENIDVETFSDKSEEKLELDVNAALEDASMSSNHMEKLATSSLSCLDDVGSYSENHIDAKDSFSSISNIQIKHIDTIAEQNISEIKQLTLETSSYCNNNESTSLTTNDTQLSRIRSTSPITTQRENKLLFSKSSSIGSESADGAESLQSCETEKVNGTNNNIDSNIAVPCYESGLEVKNEKNNNAVDAESKISSEVGDLDALVTTAANESRRTENSLNALNNHETEHSNMCNGDNHSTLENMNNGSYFHGDERQIYLEFPSEKVGLLIGKMGRNIKQLKQDSGADIMVHTVPFREDIQVLQIVGSNASVDMAASSIQKRFREVHLKEFDYSHTVDLMSPNSLMPSPPTSSSPSFAYPVPEMTQLKLPDGISVEVVVSAIADCDCIFVQQYTHPTFHALASLEHAMSLCYSSPSTPALLSPVQVGLVCVAQHMDTWYRAQVIHSNEDLSNITIKFVDYGGYSTVPTSTVKQIRADFITLPFQAAECYLDNISPPLGKNSYSPDSTRFLQELLKEGEFHAAISRYRDDGIPCIRLYKKHSNRTTLVNDILVNEGIARWIATDEHDATSVS